MSKTIILHGFNNTSDSFNNIKEMIQEREHNVSIIELPGHGENRFEASSIEEITQILNHKIRKVILPNEEYSVVAFSAGALFYLLWLQKYPQMKPSKLILIAPALFIKRQTMASLLTKVLPDSWMLPSQTPKLLRKYNSIYVWEYKNLIQGIHRFQSTFKTFDLEALIILDPKDELINYRITYEYFRKGNGANDKMILTFIRPYLKFRRPGKYHILFDKNYFSVEDWEMLKLNILEFLFS